MGEILLLSASDCRRLLTMDDCIDVVEGAFRSLAEGNVAGPASLSVRVEGGGFHVKAAALGGYFATKVNGNFFDNPARGLPRIQGAIVLCSATDGRPLAILDSISITILRTAAATAVAAKYLARPSASTLFVCGCGNQGRASIDAIARVRDIRRVILYDSDRARADALAREVSDASVVDDVTAGVRAAEICVTCTPSRTPLLGPDAAHPGLFIAAVGADSSEKQEIDSALLRDAVVIVDDLEQCASFGDLRYAIEDGSMARSGVRATLAQVVAGHAAGRLSDDETIVFDSTGIAVQDVAAATLVYERAVASKIGTSFAS